MLEIDVETLCQRLQGMWPRWKPTDLELSLWSDEVFADRDSGTMNAAIKAAWRAKKYNTPQPRDVLQQYDLLKPRASRQEESDTEPPAWIQCVEAPADFPGRLGRVVGVYAIPKESDPHDWLANIAGQMRRSHERTYGGRWIIVFGETFDEMDMRKRRLQAGVQVEAR